ncbi:glycoside hydrolase N-terminal domain-containing protein [Lachnospiraceae bacterium 46-15]
MKKKFLSVLLSVSMLMTMGGVSALAATTGTSAREETAVEGNPLRIWYDKPTSGGTTILSAGSGISATENVWQQLTLPIGNGDMGANIYGEIESEHLTFNEKTLWSGGPADGKPYTGGNLENKGNNGEQLKTVHNFLAQLADGSITDATERANLARQANNAASQLVGANTREYGSYQAWGDIYFDYQGISAASAKEYARDLDLTTGISTVSFKAGDVKYTREFFISNPDNVLVAKLAAENGGKLNLDVRFTSKQGATAVASGDSLVVAGQVSDNQMKYDSVLKVVKDGSAGSVTANGSKLEVRDAESVTVYLSAATDYKNVFNTYRTGETSEELHNRVAGVVTAAAGKGYDAVKAAHLEDYGELFSRMELHMNETVSEKPTDELLAAYKAGTASEAERRQLEIILFQYGRFLTLGSSRENSQLPANLQGVWNCKNDPPWHSDYHMNVNLQMNYWPTYVTNLAECADPLIRYVESLREPGRITAKIYAGIESTEENPENGFMAHVQCTPFGWTCPGWAFFTWGWSPAAVPWILQNCWEYYDFTRDTDYLEKNIYPMMKEEAVLYDQLLTRDSNGKLVSSPAYSPEHGPVTMGNTYEHSLIWQLYEDTIEAAEVLGKDEDKAAQWRKNQEDLKGPIEIGDSGQIKEWYEETTVNSTPPDSGGQNPEGAGHRHLSHMMGVFPGDLVSPETPEWLEAAKVSMTNRVDRTTGWGMGHRINVWARLGDGEHAYKLITDLFDGGIYPNMWDTHSPFQIDGNFGYTSGVAEMLLQSNVGYMNLLPALPNVWTEGQVKGMVARGNFEIDLDWSEGHLDEAVITSNKGGEAVVQYDNIFLAEVVDADGNEVAVTNLADNRIAFDTVEGMSYTISNIPEAEQVDAPTGLHTVRNGNQVTLSWNPVDADVTYTVYRKVGDGELAEAASGLSEAQYVDNQAYGIMGEIVYQVVAVLGSGTESQPAQITQRFGDKVLDDRDARIQYTGNWGSWYSEDEANYHYTTKHLNSPQGGETVYLEFCGTKIEVIAPTNRDRGYLDISIDGQPAERVNCYAPGVNRQSTIFSKEGLADGSHTILITVPNEKDSASSGTKVEIDAFKIYAPEAEVPELPAGKESQVLASESNRVMIQWDEVQNAESYKVYVDGEEVATSTEPYAWIENLEPEKDYTFTVKAVVNGSELSSATEVQASTTEKVDNDLGAAPDKVTGLTAVKGDSEAKAKLIWKASKDAEKYMVYIDGEYAGETVDTAYALSGLDASRTYKAMVFAVSAKNRKSDRATVSFKTTELPEESLDISSVAALSAITVKNGTTFEQLTLPKSVQVTLSSGQTQELEVTWQKGNYNGTAAGTYTLYGDIKLSKNILNPDNKKASITVTVEKGQTGTNPDPNPTPNPGPNPGPNPIPDPGVKPEPKKDDVVEAPDGSRYKVLDPKNKTAILIAVKNNKKATMSVPATVMLNGYKHTVVQVGDKVMKGNSKLKKVVLGKNVITIGKQAFMNCKNLKSVQLKGKALKTIKSGAFKKTSAKLVVSAKKMSKKQKARLLKSLKKAGAGKKTKVK